MFSHRPKSRAWLAGVAMLTFTAASGPADADVFLETVYLPTSSVVTLPTTSVLSTSYVVPTSSYLSTSYVVPTSFSSTYIPTSSVVSTDSVLVPTTTAYYRPSIFRSRRYVERTSYSYLPTTTILPTSYSYLAPTSYVRSSILSPTSYLIDDSVVTTSLSSLCDTTPTVAPTRATNRATTNGGNGQVVVSEPSNGSSAERKPSATLNSSPAGDEATSSNVVPPVTSPSSVSPPRPLPVDPGPALKEPPAIGEGASPKPPAPATGNNTEVVVPPAGQLGGTPANPNETQYRQLKRPTYESRNILRGKVISVETKRPEEGITVVVSHLNKQFSDRKAMSDADGEFKISLPDGDWVVKVVMNSGSIYTVGQDYLTASNGKITDASGRNVGEFVINR